MIMKLIISNTNRILKILHLRPFFFFKLGHRFQNLNPQGRGKKIFKMKIINQNKECELSSISIFSLASHFKFTPACRREEDYSTFTIRHVLNLQEPDSPIVDYLNQKLLRRFLMDHLSFINCQCHFKIMYQVPPHQRPLNRHLTVILIM